MPAKLPEGEGKRHAVTIRTTREIKDRIDGAAARSGRSVAQEIEARLQYSFDMDDYETAIETSALGQALDKETDEMFNQMRAAAGAATMYVSGRWQADIYSRAAVRAAIVSGMEANFRKHALDVAPDDLDRDRALQADKFGRLAGRMLAAAQSDPAMRAWISEMAAVAEAREGLNASEDNANKELRPSAALKALIGKDN